MKYANKFMVVPYVKPVDFKPQETKIQTLDDEMTGILDNKKIDTDTKLKIYHNTLSKLTSFEKLPYSKMESVPKEPEKTSGLEELTQLLKVLVENITNPLAEDQQDSKPPVTVTPLTKIDMRNLNLSDIKKIKTKLEQIEKKIKRAETKVADRVETIKDYSIIVPSHEVSQLNDLNTTQDLNESTYYPLKRSHSEDQISPPLLNTSQYMPNSLSAEEQKKHNSLISSNSLLGVLNFFHNKIVGEQVEENLPPSHAIRTSSRIKNPTKHLNITENKSKSY
jgi:hypothetical protein